MQFDRSVLLWIAYMLVLCALADAKRKKTRRGMLAKKAACQFFPCHNGATCEDLPHKKYKCICRTGFEGKRCEIAQYSCISPQWQLLGSLCYRVFGNVDVSARRPWLEANASCAAAEIGGSLVSIHSKEQNSLLHQLVQRVRAPATWIGLHDLNLERGRNRSGWQWADNSRYNYKNWQPHHPIDNPVTTTEDCGSIMNARGQWGVFPESNEVPQYQGCLSKLPYLCELPALKPCEPNPCQNGGTCKAMPGGHFTCSCTRLFTGDTCKQCLCMNGGRCSSENDTDTVVAAARKFNMNHYDAEGAPRCACDPRHWAGYLCQYSRRCLVKVQRRVRTYPCKRNYRDNYLCRLCSGPAQLEGDVYCQMEVQSTCQEYPELPAGAESKTRVYSPWI